MILTKLSKYRRSLVLGLLPLLLCLLTDVRSFAGNKEPEGTRVANVRWTAKSDVIIITYDLIGPPEDEYTVGVVMRLKDDSTFATVPLSVEGDVGQGHLAGANKGIRWHYRRDFPQGFQGESYFFEINALPLVKPSTRLYYYLIGGTALAAAGVIALFSGRNQTGEPALRELPYPPARP